MNSYIKWSTIISIRNVIFEWHEKGLCFVLLFNSEVSSSEIVYNTDSLLSGKMYIYKKNITLKNKFNETFKKKRNNKISNVIKYLI